MAFVEAPGLVDGDPHEVEFVEGDPEGADGALQDGGEGDVEGVAAFLEELARLPGLDAALIGEVDVGPTGEPVFFVPDAFTVPQQDELRGHGNPERKGEGWGAVSLVEEGH